MSHHFIVLGAGISGLATAWFLKKKFPTDQITVLEKSSRAGGWIQTIQQGDFLFENGPHSCRPQGTGIETLLLANDLGLQQEIILPAKEVSDRYIYYRGKLERLPKKITEIAFSPLMQGWYKALWKDICTPSRQTEEESIDAFFTRRIGKEWVSRIIDPFATGIYAGDCQKLSLKSCFPRFDAWEKEGSLLKGICKKTKKEIGEEWICSLQKKPLFSFRKGMETLPIALTCHLKKNIFYNQTIKKIISKQVYLENGEIIKGDTIISTLPSYLLSTLLYPHFLQEYLNKIHYITIAVVHFGFNYVLPLQGFGYLVPSQEKTSVLGCIWDSCVFPQQAKFGTSCLTVMLGGRHRPEIKNWSHQTIIQEALNNVSLHLKIPLCPVAQHVHVAKQAIPQYELGYSRIKEKIQLNNENKIFSSIISGSAWSGISVNDCIAHAKQLVDNLNK